MGFLPDPWAEVQKESTHRRRRFLAGGGLLLLLLCYAHFVFVSSRLFGSAQNTLAARYAEKLDVGLRRCAEFRSGPVVYADSATARTVNPRWNDEFGLEEATVLHNVTLFDGEHWVEGPVNIGFEHGLITKVSPASEGLSSFGTARIVDGQGRYVMPGLVDMHSHHLTLVWPILMATQDTNEVNDKSMTTAFGPLTPFVRSLDSFKPYDIATDIIRSGGVTSSLLLPGSANIMGGEAYVVKNVLRAGKDGEENTEEMLLEYGVGEGARRRYMKMACGENPRRVYGHTRMGNAWIFRQHLERAQALKEQQDEWCINAEAARESGNSRLMASLAKGGLPEKLELESTIGMLRGQVDLHNHCYEPEDFQAMFRHSKEFGFKIQAFHHALSAWKVPEMIKEGGGGNITIATFSDFGLYKQEGYEANLYAGKILEEHGVPVAYKSDHTDEGTNAKYLLFQAQNAHQFGMTELTALRSVTSVPARSLRLDHRIGFVRKGYDADLVLWSSHPLSVGATPLQVYVDGKETLDEKQSRKNVYPKQHSAGVGVEQTRTRASHDQGVARDICARAVESSSVIITGIRKSLIGGGSMRQEKAQHMTLVLRNGQVICFDEADKCAATDDDVPRIQLDNGHALPGLTAVTIGLGLEEIPSEDFTADGKVPASLDITQEDKLILARYGVHLEGKAFGRARIGGVSRAISIPQQGGMGGAVSVGIKTSGSNLTLGSEIFQPETGLHFVVGFGAKTSTDTVSAAVVKLRKILINASSEQNVHGSGIYARAASGELPLVIHTENKYDIQQLIAIKRDLPNLNLVIFGGAEAPLVADELAAANVSLIFTHHRGAPDFWEKKDILTGPPLTRSPVAVLQEAGVRFALAIHNHEGNSFIHNLPIEASWAAKYAGLSEQQAVDLVSTNVEKILSLNATEDIVVWEGNPLEFGATPAVVIDGDTKQVVSCWPVAT